MLKRSLSLCLVCAMLLPTIGCAQNTKNAGDTSAEIPSSSPVETSETTAAPETEPPIISAALPKIGFDNAPFVIVGDNESRPLTIDVEDTNGDIVNDTVHDRNSKVEEQFGVVISVMPQNIGATTIVTNAVAADDNTYSLVTGHDCTMFQLTLGGYFADLRQTPHLDFSQPWYPSYANDTYTIGGKQYMMTSYISYLALAWAQCVLMNREIATDNGIDIPYSEVEAGTWTLDRMIELASGIGEDLNGDGAMNQSDQYGMASNYKMYSLQGSYLDCYARNDKGELTLDFDRDRLISLCEKMLAFLTGPDGYITASIEPADAEKMFIDGQTLFSYTKLENMASEKLRDSDLVYGVLPIPKWDTEQENYVSGTSDRQFAILSCNDHLERTGIVTEALSSAGYNMIREAYFDVALSTRFTPDKESADMLALISNTLSCDLSFLTTTGDTTGLGRTLMFSLNSKNANLSSYFAKMIPAEQKTVNKINEYYFREVTE